MLLERVGAFAVARRVAILVTAAVLALVAIVVVVHGGRLTTGSVEGLEAVDASHAVAQITGAAEDSTIVAVFSSETMSPLDTSFRKARDLALAKARADEHVLRVTTKDDAPPLLRERMLNAKAKSETVFIVLRGDFKEAAAAYPRVRRDLAQGAGEGKPLSPLSVECTGRIPYMHDLDLVLEHDLLFAEAISLPIALALLLYVFRTWRLALVPVLCGATSVLISIALVTALSFFVEIEAYTINVMSLIGLGVAIDYSLFIVSRYREELGDVANPSAEKMASALVRSVATAGRAVLFSGLAVGVGLVGLVFFRGSVLAAMGAGGAVVVVFAVLVALVFVPAFLAVLGPRAFRGMVRKSTRAKDEARWEAFARGVMRHPWLVLIPTVTVLVLAARPFARIEMSGADVRVLDSRSEARRAYDDLARDFPDQAATRAEVVVQFPRAPALNAERIRALYTFSREVAKLPGVDKVESIVDRASTDPDEDDDAASYEENLLRPSELAAPIIAAAKSLTVGERDTVLYVRIHGASDSREARAVVAALREHRSIADGTLIVGGQPRPTWTPLHSC